MSRFLTLVAFMFQSYWRTTRLAFQLILIAVVCGIFLDPRYAPYPYNYVVLVKNFVLIGVALLTSFHFVNRAYSRLSLVLLNRVPRSWYYLASLSTVMGTTLVLGLLVDVYVMFVARLSAADLLFYSIPLSGLLVTAVVVSTAHLFSALIMSRRYQLLGGVTVFLGSIPQWYMGLPGESVWGILTYFLPPVGGLILLKQQQVIFSGHLVLAFTYAGIMTLLGLRLFKARSLSDLY